MAKKNKNAVKQLKRTSSVRKFRKGTGVRVISLSMAYRQQLGYEINLTAIVGEENYVRISGSLDTQALVTGKKPVLIKTPKDMQTPEYFIEHNVYEFNLLKENAPALYAIIVGWRNTIMTKIGDGSFDISKNGVVFVPHRNVPYTDEELTECIVWKHSYDSDEEKEYSNQLSEQFYAQKREPDGLDVYISPWLWSFIDVFGPGRAIAYLYMYSKELADLLGEIDYTIGEYNKRFDDESKHIREWGELLAKIVAEKWSYKFSTFCRVPIPGLDKTYLYYDYDEGLLKIGQFESADLEETLLPLEMVPEELQFLAINKSEDVDEESAIEYMKEDWVVRMEELESERLG